MRNNRGRNGCTQRGTMALVAAAGMAGMANAGVVVTAIVLEGDSYNGFSITSGFAASENHAVNDSGVWFVESDTTNPDTNVDGLVIRGEGALGSRSVFFTQGQSLTAPSGAAISSFDAITINASGNGSFNIFLDGTSGGNDDSGVFFNDALVIQEGTMATAAGLSPNTPYIGWFETRINDQNQIMMMASVDDPAIASTVDRAIVIVGNPNGPHTETLIAKEGDQMISGRFVADFSTGPHSMAFRNNSRVGFIADLDGDTLNDGAVFMYDGAAMQLLAREGSPSAVSGRNWGTLIGVPIDINNSGGWVMRGDLDGGTTDDSLIVKNGTIVVAREGSPVPPQVGAFNFTTFGTGAVAIADSGDVFYYGDWDDTDTTRDTGIFVNGELLVQEGVTQIAGSTLFSISAVESNLSVSPNGRYVIFEGVLADGRDGAFLIDRGGECLADYNGDTTVDFFDYLDFVADFSSNAPGADFNADTVIDFFDYLDFVAAFSTGC